MATEKRLIDANAFLAELKVDHDDIMQSPNVDKQMKWCEAVTFGRTVNALVKQPTVDAVEVVRCEKCVHCVNDEEEPGMCKCVESAEYDSESGLWLGFVEYRTPDFFCAYGERKDNG